MEWAGKVSLMKHNCEKLHQRRPGVCARESAVGHCYPVSSIHIILILILIPKEFMRASSAWQKTPMNPSHVPWHAEVSEPLGNQLWWHSNSYSVGETRSFLSQCRNIPNGAIFLRDCVYTCGLMKPTTFFRTVQHFSTSYIYTSPCRCINPA